MKTDANEVFLQSLLMLGLIIELQLQHTCRSDQNITSFALF